MNQARYPIPVLEDVFPKMNTSRSVVSTELDPPRFGIGVNLNTQAKVRILFAALKVAVCSREKGTSMLEPWLRCRVFKVLFFVAYLFVPCGEGDAQPSGIPGWWNTSWTYRVVLGIGAGNTPRTDRVVDVPVNFTGLLANTGISAAVDVSTLRVVEVDLSGNLLNQAVPFQFDPDSAFSAATNAAGTLVLRLTGTTAAGVSRYYQLYFTTAGTGATPASVSNEVEFADNVIDEGQSSFRIGTLMGTLYYQKQGAGFSSWVDASGNDWINYHPTGGSAGNYRGIPNMVYPAGDFHPGATSSTSTLLSTGPLKTTFRSQTNDGLWECLWEVYGRFARMTVVRANGAYWFLYEGTPGGVLDVATDQVVRSNGTVNPASGTWTADLTGDEWVYFADPGVGRSLFMALHEPDSAIDSYRPMNNEMTVFGFGRNSLNTLLSGTPKHFTVGLVDQTGFSPMAAAINSAFAMYQ